PLNHLDDDGGQLTDVLGYVLRDLRRPNPDVVPSVFPKPVVEAGFGLGRAQEDHPTVRLQNRVELLDQLGKTLPLEVRIAVLRSLDVVRNDQVRTGSGQLPGDTYGLDRRVLAGGSRSNVKGDCATPL